LIKPRAVFSIIIIVCEEGNEKILGSKKELSVKALQVTVDRWIKTYGVRYFAEMTNLAVLMEEVGELARIMSRTYGEQSFKAGREKFDLGDELADVLFVLVCIANQTGVDLETALSKNLKKKTDRDNHRHLNNPKLKA
jgi:NTP pyrophosphatase (non-canonical NTP hydrolase)